MSHTTIASFTPSAEQLSRAALGQSTCVKKAALAAPESPPIDRWMDEEDHRSTPSNRPATASHTLRSRNLLQSIFCFMERRKTVVDLNGPKGTTCIPELSISDLVGKERSGTTYMHL